LSINEVNFYLDKIAKSSADGKNGQKELIESIQHLLTNLSALQLKWLLRIILKDLKIGIKEHLILDAYHPDAMVNYRNS
jgi:DNA ligase-4